MYFGLIDDLTGQCIKIYTEKDKAQNWINEDARSQNFKIVEFKTKELETHEKRLLRTKPKHL